MVLGRPQRSLRIFAEGVALGRRQRSLLLHRPVPSTVRSILVRASSGVLTIGWFSLNEVLTNTGTPTWLLNALISDP